MSNELADWLRAQITEDRTEAETARALAPNDLHWTMPGFLDRTYMLADLDSKLRIIDALPPDPDGVDCWVHFGEWESCSDGCAATTLVEILKLLALPYAGREGYRSEWAPGAPTEEPQ